MLKVKDLQNVIKVASKFVAKSAIKPVLDNCYLKLSLNGLTIKATDLLDYYEKSIILEKKCYDLFETTINCKVLLKILQNIKDKNSNISLRLNAEANQFELKKDKIVYKLNTIDASEFPEYNFSEFNYIGDFNTDILKKINLASACYDENNILAAINYNGDKNTLCAFDGNRMHFTKKALFKDKIKFDKDDDAGISAMCNTIKRQVAKKPEKIINISNTIIKKLFESEYKVYCDTNYIKFVNNNKKETIVTRNIEGAFPDCEQIIPIHCNKNLKIKKEELARILKEVAVTLNERTNIMSFVFENNMAVLKTKTPDFGETSTEIECLELNTKDLKQISFNYRYIQDVLKMDANEFNFTFDHELSPALITMDNSDITCLVMPIHMCLICKRFCLLD